MERNLREYAHNKVFAFCEIINGYKRRKKQSPIFRSMPENVIGIKAKELFYFSFLFRTNLDGDEWSSMELFI